MFSFSGAAAAEVLPPEGLLNATESEQAPS